MYNNDYWNSLQLWPGHIFLFLSFQGADYFTFEGAMGDFRKKNILHTDLKGKKSCKEIPEENNSCSEHKYLSWRLMVEKNLTSLFVTENNLSVTLPKKNSYRNQSPIPPAPFVSRANDCTPLECLRGLSGYFITGKLLLLVISACWRVEDEIERK